MEVELVGDSRGKLGPFFLLVPLNAYHCPFGSLLEVANEVLDRFIRPVEQHLPS